jgi:cytochrome P450
MEPQAINDDLSLANLTRPELLVNPYLLYTRLRSEDPVHWDAQMRGWVLTRYEDVELSLSDARFSSQRPLLSYEVDNATKERLARVNRIFARIMVRSDPPDHTRQRAIVSRAFLARIMEAMRAQVQAVVDGLLDAVTPRGQMELLEDFAHPLPAIVICRLLGVPDEDRVRFKSWSEDFIRFGTSIKPSAEQISAVIEAVDQLSGLFRRLLRERKDKPQEDLLTVFAEAEKGEQTLDEEEIFANCILLLSAGHDTTRNTIGNGLIALFRHPEMLERVKADEGLSAGAFEETLRYDNPVQFLRRTAKEDITLGEKRIAKGDLILPSLGAANRDPAKFVEPDRFDVGRKEGRHLGFGIGPHFCLGAALARLEGQIAFSTLFRRLPQIRPAVDLADVEWFGGMALRGPKALPLTF